MYGRVTTEVLNIRSFPASTGNIVGTLNKDSLIEIKGQNGGWYRFDYKDSSAYVFGRYIEKVEQSGQQKGKILAEKLNVRQSASTNSDIVGVVSADQVVDVLDQAGDWLEITYNNQSAYISKKYVRLVETGKSKTGFVAVNLLNVRSQPSSSSPVTGQLPINSQVDITDHLDGWYEIKFNKNTAYVAAKYIRTATVDAEESRYFYQNSTYRNIALVPDLKLNIPNDREGRRTASTWNDYGNLLQKISERVGIDVGCALAVLCVESSGQGFNQNNANRMIIRFENHQFWRYWGKYNPDSFMTHFSYDDEKPWKQHKFRESSNDAWQSFHGKQANEWAVLEFARNLDDTAALKSISMGAPQVMGFNHKKIGYATVQQMFNNFSADIRYHIFALFDFLDTKMISSLKEHDFVKFAGYYNGAGQAEDYGRWIKDHYDAFERFNI